MDTHLRKRTLGNEWEPCLIQNPWWFRQHFIFQLSNSILIVQYHVIKRGALEELLGFHKKQWCTDTAIYNTTSCQTKKWLWVMHWYWSYVNSNMCITYWKTGEERLLCLCTTLPTPAALHTRHQLGLPNPDIIHSWVVFPRARLPHKVWSVTVRLKSVRHSLTKI